jgi:hypothetical protein
MLPREKYLLPKLRKFIRLMKSEGFIFNTADQYGESRIARKGASYSKAGKSSSAKSSKSGESSSKEGLFAKSRKGLR